MVSHHSLVLEKLVNGDMAEATSGVATLDDVDTGTFARFSQWGYTGDYMPVDPEILLDSSMIGGRESDQEAHTEAPSCVEALSFPEAPSFAETPSFDDEPTAVVHEHVFGHGFQYSKTKNGMEKQPVAEAVGWADEPAPSLKESAWLEFKKLMFDTCVRSIDTQAQVNADPCEDHTEVFLCHARLYVFAEKYDIEPLKMLTRRKIHQALVIFILHTSRVGDIVALLRYVYANIPDRDNTRDDLRELVMQYVVCHFERMAPSKEYLSLMEEGGACVSDCLSMMLSIIK